MSGIGIAKFGLANRGRYLAHALSPTLCLLSFRGIVCTQKRRILTPFPQTVSQEVTQGRDDAEKKKQHAWKST